MAIAIGDIFNVAYRWSQDTKPLEVSSLWYVSMQSTPIALADAGELFREIWEQHISAYCTNAMALREVALRKLAGLQVITKTVGGVVSFKSIRERWGEKYIENGAGTVGGVSGQPAPTFVSWGITNKVGNPRILNPATGQATVTTPAVYPRSGGFRWPGFPEVYTLTAQSSKIDTVPRANMQTAINHLLDPGAMSGVDSIAGGAFVLLSMSKESLGNPRAIREPLGEPALWTPQWVVSQVTSLVVRPRVTSQVSRKVDPSSE